MKLTITARFVALSTLVVAIIFFLFNAFVYLEFMNVTIENEKQIVVARLSDLVRRLDEGTVEEAIMRVKQIVPDPRQMVRVLGPHGQVMTASSTYFRAQWIPTQFDASQTLGPGVTLYDYENHRILVASVYLHLKNGDVTLQWLENVASLDHSIAFVFYLLLTGSIGGLALAAVSSYFLARYSLLPIREMIATARAITPGDLSSRIEVPRRKDELTELADTYNAMLDRIFLGFLRERQFVADASHELRTPLSVLEGYVQLLRRWGWEDEEIRQEAVTAIEEEVSHLRNMTNQLLTLAAIDQESLADSGVIAVANVAKRVVRKWQRIHSSHRWEFENAMPEETLVQMNEVRLEQVLRALLDNACKYTPDEKGIAVAVWRMEDQVYVRIRDEGEGILPEDLPHVTERFYRADKARSRQEGSVGLGLAICREIVEHYRGRFTVRSVTQGQGTEVEMMFPAYVLKKE
ncbi:sensor histidine kinase [Sulfoacidibacillus thermotolerans]|uniref:histidine kinase n=1 Tax=Sulfoacidibacillus thermotolerans TaxID=1765684 RepID=A0A2U3D9V0_SULT2|nr:ATP-binding protein [Sulfoacidibacillus thermotolerans]PWI58058.1 hypothetical protein BM613_05155 [Sulfoacidibacillus thermotolerans]